MEMGAGTFHPATTLRALGPKPWRAAYVQPSRRPKDGRYGENPNRFQHYYQFQVILKPNPPDLQELYLRSLEAIGLDPLLHDIRFVEDDWESPTLGAWGLGWECWCDGMEVSQFTYFQQVAGFECAPVSGELTYGLERLAMYLQGVDNGFELNFNGREGADKVTYGDVFLQAEQEYSRHNFEHADTEMLFRHFRDAEAACRTYLEAGDARRAPPHGAAGLRPVHQGEPRLQPARRPRRDLGDRAPELHPARARARQGLRRGLAPDRGRRQDRGMKPLAERHVRIAVTKVAYDLVLSATTDAGVAKLTGTGRVIHHRTQETLQELGEIDITIWGSTTEQLKTRAKTWPKHFDYVTGDYFGVATAGDHRFDIFVSGERFMRLLDLAHGSRRAVFTVRCDVSPDGRVDLVREMEISAARG